MDLLIPYEDKLMRLPHLTCLSEGVVGFLILTKMSWCDYPSNMFVGGGGGFVDPF